MDASAANVNSTNPLDYLTDYATLAERVKAGDLRITISPPICQPAADVAADLVLDIANAAPTANDFKISYDPTQDFHHVAFTLDGESYTVRWYKVFVVVRNSDGLRRDFGFYRHNIAPFFKSGKHKTEQWHR